jgi:hypothetical protein
MQALIAQKIATTMVVTGECMKERQMGRDYFHDQVTYWLEAASLEWQSRADQVKGGTEVALSA